MPKRIFSLIICIFVLFGITGCDNTDKAYIYFNLPEKPQTLDPQIAESDAELLIVRNIYEGLLRKDKDGKIVCGVAENYQKDGLTYTFNLKKDAEWNNGEPLTAYDFVFGFKRAVLPETKSPFASRLFAVKNAKEINGSKQNPESLGVTAVDEHTLKIELSAEDEKFEETLTTPVCMPCNEEFFLESGGKYGMFKKNILSNGSYKLTKWATDIFGIRLYRDDNYKGDFKAKNAAVFLSQSQDKTSSEVLLADDADMAFIPANERQNLKDTDFKIESHDNICWFLTISNDIPSGIRKSFANLSSGEVFQKDLTDGYSVANSVFPPVLNSGVVASGMQIYDLDAAKALYSEEVKKLENKKFPAVTLYYYNDGFSKKIVTDIVGHLQNNLGAFINIEEVSAPDVLESQLINQTYKMSIFPVSASSSETGEYLQKFGIKYNGQNLTDLQINLLKSNNIVPLMFQSTSLAYSKNLSNVRFEHGNGSLDFSFIIKKAD